MELHWVIEDRAGASQLTANQDRAAIQLFVSAHLPLQLLDDLLPSLQSHLLSLLQPAAHVFDLGFQPFLHPLQVQRVLLLQTQLLPDSSQLTGEIIGLDFIYFCL